NQANVLLGKPLVGMWTYDVLCAFRYLQEKRFKSVSVAGSGVYPGLVALLAVALEPQMKKAAIDGLFSSFVSIVGQNWIAEIPGILRVADIEQLASLAGVRVVFNNLQPCAFSVSLKGEQQTPLNF